MINANRLPRMNSNMWLLFLIIAAYFLCFTTISPLSDYAMMARYVFPAFLIVSVASGKASRSVKIDFATMMLFVIAIVPSLIYSIDVGTTMVKTVSVLAMFGSCSLYFSSGKVNDQEFTTTLYYVFLLYGGITACYWIMHINASADTGIFRLCFANRNALSATFAFASVLSMGTYLQYRRLSSLAASLYFMIVVFTTQSRGGFIGMIAGYALLLVTAVRKSTVMLLFGLLIGVIYFAREWITSIPVIHRLIIGLLDDRVSLWTYAIKNIELNLWFGTGYATSSLTNGLGVYSGMNYHNSYLGLLSDVGIFGTVVIGIMFLRLMSRGYLSMRKQVTSDCRTILAVIVSFLVMSVGEGYLIAAGSPISFVFWCCIILSSQMKI